ncbi:MAG: isoleucine--tRNA ligase [Nanoarchaeota archaeon]
MQDHNQIEKEVSEFWKKSKIFEKTLKKSAPKGDYIFYDGPPFITGLPHYASLLPSIVKDTVPRFWTMNGFRVERKWGWDCHGLPAENQVEKELGLKNKKDIQKLGIGNFVSSCKNYVNNVSGQWQWYIDKIARWVDMDHAYRTMDLKFMESVIWSFKGLFEKGLIYEGYRSSLHCPRCATPLSKFEITMDAGSYKDVTELSVVVKFKLKDAKLNNAYVLAWTTTPWTLPGNLALAINENIKYVLIEIDKEFFIIAKDRIKDVLKNKNFAVKKELKGKELTGLSYEPLFNLKNNFYENKNNYKIYSGDFVTVEDGTGIVHIAPNFGEDDFEFGKKYDLSMIELMDENGTYTSEAGEFAGLYFKDAGKEVIKKIENKLFDKFNYTHSYPFCYRCASPLIYKAQKAWYLDIDKIRKKLLKTNENINWIPEHFKDGRFKYNLETAPHWCLSRSRYWGTPIPVWKCEKCEEIKVVGSIGEIEKLSGKKLIDMHKPEIDEHKFKCKCGALMNRVPEILDCWFESGSMPYAQWHYPFEKENDFKKIFPADFIIEYTGQLRGWFYYLHVLSNSLFNSECFKNVVVTGVLAGTDGRKMSKSYGNYPDPKETLEKYGGDALRMYFLASPIILGDDMNISEKDIEDSLRKNVMILYNSFNFYETSAIEFKEKTSKEVTDRWIISRSNQLMKDVTENMIKYNIPAATRPITEFLDDLSLWYIRQNRERLDDKEPEALSTIKNVFFNLSKVLAPFMPYASEYIWQKITKNNFNDESKSVHLETWPEFNEKLIDLKLIEKMKLTREIVSKGLAERDKAKIGLKWPLAKAIVKSDLNIEDEFKAIISKQLNVKKIEIKKTKEKELSVELDLKLTSELEEEGFARELTRIIQAERKNAGLIKEDLIELEINSDIDEIFKKQKEFIKQRVNANEIFFLNSGKKFNYSKSGKIKDKIFKFQFKKV